MATAAGDSDEDGSNLIVTNDDSQSLMEFVRTHTLPQSVAVTQGSFMSQTTQIERGDVLLLRAVTPCQVSLSFYDSDNCQKREVLVSPDHPVRFLVIPSKECLQGDAENPPSSGNRPVSIVTYPTVADLLLDSPTYFEATAIYDDPYLPGFSVSPGDKFRFVKTVIDATGKERLQCINEGGQLVSLSLECRGNFIVLKDDTAYTLRNLINLAKVQRRLKLAPENNSLKLSVNRELKHLGNHRTQFKEIETKEKMPSIPGLPMTFTGIITMLKPEEKLEISPLDSPDTKWIISLDAGFKVRQYSDMEYEMPVHTRLKPMPLNSFVTQNEYQFPIHAVLVSYSKPPPCIADALKECTEMIAHDISQTRKLFVKDANKDEYFCISESEDIIFTEMPRMLHRIEELLLLPLGSQVRVLADVAADFPRPFVLRYGDVLRVTKLEYDFWKVKRSNSGEIPIVKCERILKGGNAEKLKLPTDLEIQMIHLIDLTDLKQVKLADLFSGQSEILRGSVSAMEAGGRSYHSLPTSLIILQILPDPEILVSPLNTNNAISPLVPKCVSIPVRHKVSIALKRKLDFPEGYFILPSERVSIAVEQITEAEFEEAERAQKLSMEYEDIGTTKSLPSSLQRDVCGGSGSSAGRSNTWGSGSSESLPKSGSSTFNVQKYKKRISRVLNISKWRQSKAEPEELLPPASGLLTLSLQPPRAAENEYMADRTEEIPHPQVRGPTGNVPALEEPEEDPYEDITISVPPTLHHRQLTSSVSDSFASALSPPLPVLPPRSKLSRSSEQFTTITSSSLPIVPDRKTVGSDEHNQSSTSESLSSLENKSVSLAPCSSEMDATKILSSQLSDSEHSPMQPRRPRRKIDQSSSQELASSLSAAVKNSDRKVSQDSFDPNRADKLTSKTSSEIEKSDVLTNNVTMKVKPVRIKPTVPSKPTILPRVGGSVTKSVSQSVLEASKPIAPPRKKAVKADSKLAETVPQNDGVTKPPQILRRKTTAMVSDV